MTAPAAAKKTAPAAAKNTPAEVKSNVDERIPEALRNSPIFADFLKRYMEAFDEITAYNKEVLAARDSEWNATKVIAEAKKFASPEKAEDVVPEIKSAVDEWEKALAHALELRKKVLDATSKKLGINLATVADRDSEKEESLKEKRKLAFEIGKRLADIASLTTDDGAGKEITDFLTAYGMPAVGRDQTRVITTDGASTPKYRVTVTVFNSDGEKLLEEKGFTKSALGLTKPVFGYDRGKAPKSEDLRKVWEGAGNSAEKTEKSTVEFEDNNLKYVITKS